MAPVANSWSYGNLARIATPSSAKAKEAAASASRARRDERTARDELRPIYLRGAVLSGAAGSAYYEAGATKLFCAVHGPRAAGSGAPADAAAAQLACEVRWAGFARAAGVDTRAGSGPGAATGAAADRERDAGFATDEERELGAALARAMAAAVRLERYPKSRIEVSVFVLEDGGGVAAAAVTAVSLALSDAGVEVFDLMAGCAAAVVDGKVTMDPCATEEAAATATVTVAYMPTLARVTNVTQKGNVDVGQLVEAVKQCCGGAAQVAELMRNCLVKQAQKSLKKRKSRG